VLLTFRRVKNFSVIGADDGASRTNIFITGGARRLEVQAACDVSAARLGYPHPGHLQLRVGVAGECSAEEGLLDRQHKRFENAGVYRIAQRELPIFAACAIHLFSKNSAAASLRSTCGPERRPPECRTQRSPTPTPQVGQGTEANCLGVSS